LYAPWLGQLAKLAFLGSAVHQAVFTLVSTLPFAVGQVRLVCLCAPCAPGPRVVCEQAWKGKAGEKMGKDAWWLCCSKRL